jgi:hypothetical protein
MKFLESKEISSEKDNIKVIFKPINAIHQSRLLGYQAELMNAIKSDDLGRNIQVQMKTVVYALQEMVNKLFISDEELDPQEVADCADISDQDTFDVMKKLYEMVTSLLVEGETKKKSSSRPSRTKEA